LPIDVREILANQEALDVVQRFNDLYYTSNVASDMVWRGVPILKNPCDLWTAIEILSKLQPVAVVETGTNCGGSALFYSDILRLLTIQCKVITIDINPKWSVDPEANGITSLVGYSTNRVIVDAVGTLVKAATDERGGHVLVMLDSDHSMENVVQELQLYSGFVTAGSYVIVEDTNVNGHPSLKDHGPGPWEAVQAFLAHNNDFEVDYSCQRHLLTSNPSGYLRRGTI
jgi:cephalosporin hydroxylase